MKFNKLILTLSFLTYLSVLGMEQGSQTNAQTYFSNLPQDIQKVIIGMIKDESPGNLDEVFRNMDSLSSLARTCKLANILTKQVFKLRADQPNKNGYQKIGFAQMSKLKEKDPEAELFIYEYLSKKDINVFLTEDLSSSTRDALKSAINKNDAQATTLVLALNPKLITEEIIKKGYGSETYSKTALEYALDHCREFSKRDIVDVLIDLGARIEVTGDDTIENVNRIGYDFKTTDLIEHGMNARNAEGRTPLLEYIFSYCYMDGEVSKELELNKTIDPKLEEVYMNRGLLDFNTLKKVMLKEREESILILLDQYPHLAGQMVQMSDRSISYGTGSLEKCTPIEFAKACGSDENSDLVKVIKQYIRMTKPAQ